MKQKRASVINPALEQIRILKTAQALNMDSKTIERLYAAFERHAGKQLQMSFTLVLEVLKKQENISSNRSQFQDYFDTKSNSVEFAEFCKVYLHAKKLQEQADHEEVQIVNSFVALGGQSDRTGFVKKSMIINIIKNQFELTFDIQQLLQRSGDTENLDYDAFSHMFTKVQQSQRDLMRVSFTSITASKAKQEDDGLKVKYQDFQNWLLLNGV